MIGQISAQTSSEPASVMEFGFYWNKYWMFATAFKQFGNTVHVRV